MNQVNVLLTGAGGNLAHFIRSALYASKLKISITVCDYSPFAVGLYQESTGYIVPAAKEQTYIPKIIAICKKEQITCIMAGGMAEQRVLAAYAEEIYHQTNAVVISSSSHHLLRMEDKYALACHLKDAGFNYPRSVLPTDETHYGEFIEKVPFPYVVKDRFGAGSQSIGIAQNLFELQFWQKKISNPVIQEYIYPDDEEYTVGVFVGKDHCAAGSIVMKRWLDLGMTFKAKVLPESDLGPYCEKVIHGLNCLGPANIQLRMSDKGPIIFEINPRFSSTTSARAHYGFNETEMSIRHFVFGEKLQKPSVLPGTFFRVIEDVYVSSDKVEAAQIKQA